MYPTPKTLPYKSRDQVRQDAASLQSLATAMQIMIGKGKIKQIYVRDDKVRVEMTNGASFEITPGKDGFTSTQTGLPDPE